MYKLIKIFWELMFYYFVSYDATEKTETISLTIIDLDPNHSSPK